MAIARIVGCFILWLGIVPLCAGILPTFCVEKRPRHIGTTYLMGWLFMTAVFQLLAVPFIIIGYSFSSLCKTFMICMGLLSIIGVVVAILDIGNGIGTNAIELPSVKKKTKGEIASWVLFGVLFLFQLFMAVAYMTSDGDDSYFVTHASISVSQDTMYRINAYTGFLGAPDYRHALAPFSMFIAFLAKRSGLHVAIVAHTILPLFLIPVAYLTYYKIGEALFHKEREKLSAFMVIMAGIQIFGGASYYTRETFFLTRIWQGKSVAVCIMLPIMLYLVILLARYTSVQYVSRLRILGIYMVMFMANISCALMSSLGMFIISFFTFVMMVVIAIRNKRLWLVPTGIITFIPSGVFMCMYVFLR